MHTFVNCLIINAHHFGNILVNVTVYQVLYKYNLLIYNVLAFQ